MCNYGATTIYGNYRPSREVALGSPQDFLWGLGSKCGNIYRTDGETEKIKLRGTEWASMIGLES